MLDQVIEVFDLPEFALLGKDSSGSELCNGFGIGRMLIDSDHTRSGLRGVGVSRSRGLGHLLFDRTRLRSCTRRGVQRFDEEACGRLSVPGGTEQKLPRVPVRIDRPVEILSHFFTLMYVSSTLQESLQAFR